MGVERAQDLFPTLGYVEDLLAPDLRWSLAGNAHPNRCGSLWDGPVCKPPVRSRPLVVDSLRRSRAYIM